MYGISSSHVYYIWYIKITFLDINNTWYIYINIYIYKLLYIQYLIFGYPMISPIRVGYCVQVRVNVGRCTTDYWWKCGIGNLSPTAKGGLRLYTVWSRAASPMRNLWKPGAKSLCICICMHLLYLFILDSRCYNQFKSCHIYSVYQSKNSNQGKQQHIFGQLISCVSGFISLNPCFLTQTGIFRITITHGSASVTSAVFASSCRALVVFQEVIVHSYPQLS